MSELLDFYEQQARKGFSTNPWLADLQAQGLHEFTSFGFPTRHDEDWKYTVVDTLLQHRFVQQYLKSTADTFRASDLPIGSHLTIRNGQILGDRKSVV